MGSLSLDMMRLPGFYKESVAWVGQIFIPP